MLEMVDIAFMIVGITSIGLSLYLLIIMKEFRTLFIWGVSLVMVEVSLAWMQHDIKWHIVAMMIFFLFVLVFMLVKIKRRIRVLLKRLAKIEEEERQEKEREARKEKIHAGAAEMAELYRTDPDLKELNEFVGDYRDHDFV